MDVVSMLMILFYHCACYQEIFTGKLSSGLYLLISLFVTFGLTCFTFSSGFKLAINHHSDIKNNDFFCKYIAKRTLSLAKIYFFYPLICLIIYGILFLFNLSKLAQPYISSIGSINYDSFFNWFFGSVPPVAGHLWFIFVLIIVNIIALLIYHYLGIYGVICVMLFLIGYFFSYPHVLQAICISELPYYTLMYLIIFLSGLAVGTFYTTKPKLYKTILSITSCLFFCLLILYIILDVRHQPINNQFIITAFYRNVFLRWGLTYPCFILSLLHIFHNIKPLSFLTYIKQDTLYIYLLQYPFVIPIYTKILFDINIPHTYFTIVSFLLSLLSCIIIHRLIILLKKIISTKKS